MKAEETALRLAETHAAYCKLLYELTKHRDRLEHVGVMSMVRSLRRRSEVDRLAIKGVRQDVENQR